MNTKFFEVLPVEFERRVPGEKTKASQACLNTRLFVSSAKNSGYDIQTHPDFNAFILSKNGKSHILYRQQILTELSAMRVVDNKVFAKTILKSAEITTPNGYEIRPKDDRELRGSVFSELNKPLVVKPVFGTFGHNVFTDIEDEKDFNESLDTIFSDKNDQDASKAIVEEQVPNASDYRLFCTREECLGVIHRIPANVKGNGKSTITKLIADKNKTRAVHKKIIIDSIAKKFLAKQGLNPESIIPAGKQVFLRRAANTSAGGDCLQVTNEIHESLKDLAIRSVRAFPGLAYGGVDILSADGAKDQSKLGSPPVVIEVNHSADVSAFYFPSNEKPLDIVRLLLEKTFSSYESTTK